MNPFLICGVVAVLLASGCSKHQPAAAPEPSAGADTAPPSPRAPGFLSDTSAVAVVNETGNMDATLAQLSAELRRYVIGTRTVPRSFEDFAAKSRLQAPPPPAGKKYAIQGQAVVLVNR
jgi:hypothetical protein